MLTAGTLPGVKPQRPCHLRPLRHLQIKQHLLRAVSKEPNYQYDVVALGNLCVDVVLPVPELPSSVPSERAQLLQRLTADPPDKSAWELGGNCNFMIAAARLGMQVASVGQVGLGSYRACTFANSWHL